jgi:group II intron reverse transcriptase/maturase
MARISSLSEKPRSDKPRKLADWLNPTGEMKVHSLVDKIYKLKNLELAWEKVKRNKGAAGIDGQSIDEFENNRVENLKRLHDGLKNKTYQPQPVKQQLIPKSGQPGKYRPLGIPTIFDRVCQQAILNRLEPIFEPVFDEANFGYRRGRSTKDALRKIWKEIEEGNEWIVDADLRDFFGSACHQKLLTLFNQRIADGRVLTLLESIMKAGCIAEGKRLSTEQGVPQGGVISPLASNVLLTPFDREMRRKGYQLTRFADDWVVTCRTRAEAQAVLEFATKVLNKLGVVLNKEKTKIVHVRRGFEFLGYKIKRGSRPLRLPPHKIKSGIQHGALYAFPREKSIANFREQIKKQTRRKSPLSTQEIIDEINPIIRGWGNYFCKAHVRGLFNRLDRWIRRRIWSQRCKRWRNCGWKILPVSKLKEKFGLVSLINLIPSLSRQ